MITDRDVVSKVLAFEEIDAALMMTVTVTVLPLLASIKLYNKAENT